MAKKQKRFLGVSLKFMVYVYTTYTMNFQLRLQSFCMVLCPMSLRTTLRHLAYEGHQSIVRTNMAAHGYNGQRLQKIMYCCKQNDKSVHTHLCPMQPVDLPQGPFQNVAADVVGPFKATMYDSLCHNAIRLLQ